MRGRALPILLPDGGDARMQWVFAPDVAEACVRAIEVPEAVGEAFNVGHVEPTTRCSFDWYREQPRRPVHYTFADRLLAMAQGPTSIPFSSPDLVPSSLRSHLTCFLFALASAAPALAQEPMPVALEETQQIDLLSEVNGHTYRLFVALPNVYAADDTTRHPVLYLLDGYRTFLWGTPGNGLA